MSTKATRAYWELKNLVKDHLPWEEAREKEPPPRERKVYHYRIFVRVIDGFDAPMAKTYGGGRWKFMERKPKGSLGHRKKKIKEVAAKYGVTLEVEARRTQAANITSAGRDRRRREFAEREAAKAKEAGNEVMCGTQTVSES